MIQRRVYIVFASASSLIFGLGIGNVLGCVLSSEVLIFFIERISPDRGSVLKAWVEE